MPDVAELGRKVKAKYPQYADLPDAEVGRRVKAKFPGAYDDFTDAPAAQPPAEEPGFFSRTASNIGTGLQRTGATLGEAALAISDFVRGAQTGDVRPATEIGERAVRTVATLMGESAGGGEIGEAFRDPAALAAAQQRSETRRLTESPFKEGFQDVKALRQRADVRAARDPSLTGKIVRRGTEFVTTAAPAIATGYATGGSLPALATLATLQSAGQPENLPFNVALEAAPIPVGQAFKQGVGAIRRAFGKGAAQVIEAEAAPAAVAQVRREIGEAAPEVAPIAPETPLPATQAGGALPTPAADPLQSVFAKVGTDDVTQIGEMIASANRRFRQKSTPAERQQSIADYNALNQLTPDEQRALSQVLPARTVSPVGEFAEGGYSREIRDIPMSEPDPQLDANLRELEQFFGAQGRQAAQPAAVQVPIAQRMAAMARTPTSPVSVTQLRGQFPNLSKQQFDDEMIRLSDAGEISLMRHDAPGQLSAAQKENMVKVGNDYHSAATVRGPSVSAPMDAMNVLAGGRVGNIPSRFAGRPRGRPPAPPPDDIPTGFGGGKVPEEQPKLFALPPVEGVPAGFGEVVPRSAQPLFDFAPSVSLPRRIWERATNELLGGIGALKSLKSTADISYPMRQGALLLLRPLQWRQAGKMWANMFRAFRTKDFEAIKQGIAYHPNMKAMDESGLYLATRGGGEEAFGRRAGSKVSEFVEKVPGIKHSNQAYTAAADTQRVQAFDQYKKLIDKAGLSTAETEKAYKAAAEWINIATGRGSLGQRLDRAMEGLNLFFFSPRYVASRLNVFNPVMYARNASSPGGRVVLKQQMKDLAQFASVVATTLYLAKQAGADVGLNPESPDFGKIKIGTKRYDIGAGLQQVMRAGYRIGADIGRAGRGEKPKFGKTAIDIGETFLSYKLAPVPATFRSFINTRTPSGKPFTPGRAAAELAAPIQWADFVDAWVSEGLGSAAATLPGAVGIGVGGGPSSKPVDAAIEKAQPIFTELQRLNKRVSDLRQKEGEAPEAFQQRVKQFSSNYTTYGLRLVQHPRFQSAPDDIKRRALDSLNERAKGITHRPLAFPELELDAGLLLDAAERKPGQ